MKIIDRQEGKMRDRINLTIHEDDLILIEIMGVYDANAYTPAEQDITGRTVAKREIILGNITVRIYEA